eukprot:6338180-Heterocapsa_arctica.AAC.1
MGVVTTARTARVGSVVRGSQTCAWFGWTTSCRPMISDTVKYACARATGQHNQNCRRGAMENASPV